MQLPRMQHGAKDDRVKQCILNDFQSWSKASRQIGWNRIEKVSGKHFACAGFCACDAKYFSSHQQIAC
jgi:hypothetical protein